MLHWTPASSSANRRVARFLVLIHPRSLGRYGSGSSFATIPLESTPRMVKRGVRRSVRRRRSTLVHDGPSPEPILKLLDSLLPPHVSGKAGALTTAVREEAATVATRYPPPDVVGGERNADRAEASQYQSAEGKHRPASIPADVGDESRALAAQGRVAS
jgi:hypothetical protein